jgi:hypothetical protein
MRSLSSGRPWVQVLLILSLLLPTILTLGPLATPASAEEPSINRCVAEGEVIPEIHFDGTPIYWICHIKLRPDGTIHRWWSVKIDGPYKSVNKASARPDSYTRLNVLIGQGRSNGLGVVGYQVYTGNSVGTLIRPIQVRLLIRNRTTGGTCLDTGWQGPSAAASHATVERSRDLPGACGGAGSYEALGYGRFYSSIQNQWIGTGWVSSGVLTLVPH